MVVCGALLQSIEWLSDVEAATIPYGLLLRVWPKKGDHEHKQYISPVDGKHKWWAIEEARR